MIPLKNNTKNEAIKTIAFFLFLFMLSVSMKVKGQDNNELRKIYSSFNAGEIVSTPSGYFDYGIITLSKEAYDIHVVGVIKPNLNYSNPKLMANPVQKEGVAKVKYSNENGTIKKGDLVTTSSTPGVAMKATTAGMILGIAMEDGSEGMVPIRIMIQYANPK